MDTIFMNSENSETCDPHRLALNLDDKIDSRRSHKYIALSNLIIYYTWKNIKSSYKYKKIVRSKCQVNCGMINSNYLMNYIL